MSLSSTLGSAVSSRELLNAIDNLSRVGSYGSEGYHLTLRKEITDWMAGHPDRYAGFVEDDRGLDEHLRCMRMAGKSFQLSI